MATMNELLVAVADGKETPESAASYFYKWQLELFSPQAAGVRDPRLIAALQKICAATAHCKKEEVRHSSVVASEDRESTDAGYDDDEPRQGQWRHR